MLVVCNGAFKSGSTWLYEIVRAVVQPTSLPVEYGDPAWLPVESIARRRMRRFLAEINICQTDFVVKQHMSKPGDRRLLDERPDIRLVDIRRDVRDVVVSSYFHFQALGFTYRDFESFYWSHGRHVADGVLRHDRLWRESSALVLSYEQMTRDLPTAVATLGTFLGRSSPPDLVASIEEAVALPSLRMKYKATGISGMSSKQFFRQGGSGGWRVYFNESMLQDVDAISASGLPLVERLAWSVRIRLRRLQRARRSPRRDRSQS